MGNIDWSLIDRDIVEIDDRPSDAWTLEPRVGYVEEEPMVRGCETSYTENLIVSNTWTIQARNATYVPGQARGDSGSIVHTVDVLTGAREHYTCRGKARKGNGTGVRFDEYVEAVEGRHAGNINREIDMHTATDSCMCGGCYEDGWGHSGIGCGWSQGECDYYRGEEEDR